MPPTWCGMRLISKGFLGLLLGALLVPCVSCGGGGLSGPNGNSNTSATGPSGISVTIFPGTLTLAPAATYQFTAQIHGTSNGVVQWACSAGNIDQSGKYTAPNVDGSYSVFAQAQSDTSVVAICRVTVSG